MANVEIFRKRINTTQDLSNWVKEMTRRERLRYRSIWVTWLKNLLAFHGANEKEITDDLRVVPRLSPTQKKILDRINVNFISPHVRTMASKLQRAKPILECLPSTSDEEDILAANVGDRLLRGEWYNQNLDMTRLQAAVWMFSCGNAFIHTYFDPWRGTHLGEGIFTGEIVSEVVNPFKIIFEPNRNKFTNCRWVIIRERLPVDEVVEKYEATYHARTGEMLDLPQGIPESDDVADAYLDVIGLGRNNIGSEDFTDVEYVYHVPTARYPSGRYAILCGDQVLHEGPFPYPYLNRLNIVHLQEILSPWRMYGDTSTTEVLRCQDHYNDLRRIEHDYHEENMRAVWLKHKATRMRRRSMVDPKNKILEYDGQNPPTKMPAIGMPSSMYQSIELSRKELERAGLADVSHAIPATGVTSGKAILALQEQDDVKLMMTSQLLEAEYGRLGQNILLMAKHNYKAKRKFGMVGDVAGGAVWFFDRAELRGTTDVRCVAGSALPFNKIAKQEQVKEHIAMGLYGGPEEAVVRARKVLDVGVSEDIFDDTLQDAQVQEKENIWMEESAKQLLMSGVQDPMAIQQAVLPVSPVDNHLVHIKVLLRRAKSPGVRDVPGILAVFVAHYQMHLAQMNPQQMAQLQGQQAGVQSQNPNLQAGQPIVEQPLQTGGVNSEDLNQTNQGGQ